MNCTRNRTNTRQQVYIDPREAFRGLIPNKKPTDLKIEVMSFESSPLSEEDYDQASLMCRKYFSDYTRIS